MVVVIYAQSGRWIASIENVLQTSEINAFQERAIGRAEIVQAVLAGFQTDAAMFSAYATELFRTDLSNELPLNVSK